VAVGEHSYSPGLFSPLAPTAFYFVMSVFAQACSEGVLCGLHENFDCCERRSLQLRQTARRRDCAHVPLPRPKTCVYADLCIVELLTVI